MRVLPFSEASIAEAVKMLRAGSVVAHATETCYGFACDLANPAAVAALFAIKNRPAHQPVSALFASVDDAKKYVIWNARAEELAKKHLPGPLTLILPLRPDAPTQLFPTPIPSNPFDKLRTGQQPATIGVRISSHPHAQALIAAIGTPLSTTSANLHGQPSPYSAQEITGQPALILDSGALPNNPPSTVIDLTKENLKTLRQGNVNL